MPFSEDFEVDRLRVKFPRSYRALYELYPAAWQEMLSAIERAMHEHKTAAVVVGKLSILRGLDRDVRKWVLLSIQADRKEVLLREQKSFLTELHDRSLDDLLAELNALEQKNLARTRGLPGDEHAGRGEVLISHHASSANVIALALAPALERLQTRCWVAPRDIPPGSVWPWEVYAAAQRCAALVLLVTEPALKSRAVAGEVAIAVGRGVPICVVRLGDADPAAINPALAAYQHVQDWIDRSLADIDLLARDIRPFLLGDAIMDR